MSRMELMCGEVAAIAVVAGSLAGRACVQRHCNVALQPYSRTRVGVKMQVVTHAYRIRAAPNRVPFVS